MNHWPLVPLARIVKPVERAEVPVTGNCYRQVGVKLWGAGAYERESIDGGGTQYKTLSRVEANDIIVNKIWARNGSVAVIPKNLAGCYVSSEFSTFKPNPDIFVARWFHWITKTPFFWKQCDAKSQGTSGKNRIRPERFLEIEIPLPPLPEQRRIVARIEELAAKINEVCKLRDQQRLKVQQLLVSAFWKISRTAPRIRMGDVAPLVRRPVDVDLEASYPELGIRSFGNGTFHKPALSGSDVGSKRIYRIEPGDLLFSNVFAWEGAIAVARSEDAGRFGSHRFIACVPRQQKAFSRFLCFYFLTDEGLELIRAASPGWRGKKSYSRP
jgi:type I restriction enzyme S subunit